MVTVRPTTTFVSKRTPIFSMFSTSRRTMSFGQAELGDAVDEDAADLVQGLEDGDVVALLDEVAGGGEGGGAAAHAGDLLAGGRGARRQAELARTPPPSRR